MGVDIVVDCVCERVSGNAWGGGRLDGGELEIVRYKQEG